MKKAFYLLAILLLFSCKTVEEKHISTSFKLFDCLRNNQSDFILSNFFLFDNHIGHNLETVNKDCKTINLMINKYGIPSMTSVQYTINESDYYNKYIVDIKFHEGNDTFRIWKISKVVLRVTFSSLELNPPNKIFNYELKIDREGLIKEDTTLPEYQFLENAFK